LINTVLLTFVGILITRLQTAPSSGTQSGMQALSVVTTEKTPASPIFESPLPTPSPTALAVAPTATASPIPISSPVPPPTELPISPLPSVTATPAPGEWRQFTDPEAGYTISYPANSIFSAGPIIGEKFQQLLITFQLDNVQKYHYAAMSLLIRSNKNNRSIDEVAKDIYKDMSGGYFPQNIDLDSKIEEKTIAGLSALQTDIIPDSTSVHVLIPHKDKVYIFALVHELTTNTSDPRAVELFYNILDSFRMLKEK